MKIAIHKETEIEPTIRTELLSSMFEVPATTKLSVTLSGDLNLESQPWNIGLIVGPSGSGKTLLLNELFGAPERLEWGRRSVIDDFPSSLSMEDISRVCQSVGFNTIPSWLRPYNVLSNGERFRAEMARILLGNNTSDVCTVDEFTSVVDRQVAQFACHSVQKFVRERAKKLVVASCHYDIIDWLQPDWILEPGNPCRFSWRSLHGRPPISCRVSRVKYETWRLFREFHYMSAELNRAARCYGIYVSTAGLESRFLSSDMDSCPDGGNNNQRTDSELRLPSDGSSNERRRDSEMVLRGDKESADSWEDTSESASEIFTRSAKQNGYRNSGSVFAGNEIEFSTCISTSNEDRTSYIQNSSRGGTFSGRLGRPGFLGEPIYRIASMCGVLHRPHPRVSDICGFTRMVTLPDFQGLGLAFVLACKVASAYKALGKRLHSYPNHPAWIRSYQRSSLWMQVKDSGSYSPRRGTTSTVGGFGNKRCAVFLFVGDAMNREEAERLVNVET